MKFFHKTFSSLLQLAVSRTAVNTYLVFTGNGLSAFFAFLFTVTAFRLMTIADFGYFSAMWSFLLLISDLADWGIGTSLSAFLPPMESQVEKLLSFLKSAFAVQCIIAVSVTVVLLILSSGLSEILFHTRKLVWLIQIGVIGIFGAILANFFQYSLSARQKFMQVSFLSAYSSILRVIFFLFLIVISYVNLASVAWLQIVTIFATTVTAFIFLKSDFLKVKRVAGDVKRLMKFTSFIGIARGMTAFASRLDVLMLIALRGATEAGIYSTASRVISIYPLLAGSFSTVIAPKLSATVDPGGLQKFMMKVILGTLGIIATILFLMIIAEPFMVILFSEKARPAVGVFQLLLLSMIFFVASIPVVALVIYYLRKPQILSVNGILQLIIVVLGNLYFIPKFGKLGPAYSLILSYGITLFTTAFFCLIFLRRKHAQS